jgi:hypothetical protein
MVELVTRKRLDILVDAPLSDWLVETAARVGIAHYTFMNMADGRGRHGGWRADELSGASSKRMFIAIADADKVRALIDALAPHLTDYGLVVTIATVEVVRGERF